MNHSNFGNLHDQTNPFRLRLAPCALRLAPCALLLTIGARSASAQAFNLTNSPMPQRATATAFIDSVNVVNPGNDPNWSLYYPLPGTGAPTNETQPTTYIWKWAPSNANPLQPPPTVTSITHKYKVANATAEARKTGNPNAVATAYFELSPPFTIPPTRYSADTGIANPHIVKGPNGFVIETIPAGRFVQRGADVDVTVTVAVNAYARGIVRDQSSIKAFVGPLDATGQVAHQGVRIRTEYATLNY